jgi:hypothetical protein
MQFMTNLADMETNNKMRCKYLAVPENLQLLGFAYVTR